MPLSRGEKIIDQLKDRTTCEVIRFSVYSKVEELMGEEAVVFHYEVEIMLGNIRHEVKLSLNAEEEPERKVDAEIKRINEVLRQGLRKIA